MADRGSATFPEVVEWTLRNKRTNEERRYEQTELTIEGEARLLGIVQKVAANLTAEGFPFDKLSTLFDVDRPIDWVLAAELLGMVSGELPDVVSDTTCLFFGILPTLEDGTRNPEFESERRFIRGAMTFSRWVDIVQVFASQNDYQRLAAPFGKALAMGVQMGTPESPMLTESAASPEPSTSSSRRATGRRGASSAP
jgi:hypothetical protein